MPMHGRVSLVTGGAGSIGGAISRRLAAAGSRVVVLDVDGAAAAADGLEGEGHLGITASVVDSVALGRTGAALWFCQRSAQRA